MGTGPLYLKRDDLTGFAIGGNKARPLEFLVAAAVTDRADTLVTARALAGFLLIPLCRHRSPGG